MRFPDPNIGYICGYKSTINNDGFLITFMGGTIKILFKFDKIKSIKKEIYRGGKISWNVIRWEKCPTNTEALRISLKEGIFKEHFITFDNLKIVLDDLKKLNIKIEE